jgi:hypothetical protein
MQFIALSSQTDHRVHSLLDSHFPFTILSSKLPLQCSASGRTLDNFIIPRENRPYSHHHPKTQSPSQFAREPPTSVFSEQHQHTKYGMVKQRASRGDDALEGVSTRFLSSLPCRSTGSRLHYRNVRNSGLVRNSGPPEKSDRSKDSRLTQDRNVR